MTLTRTVVRTWLGTARLPITLAESALRRGQVEAEWPPALAFSAFEAGVKQAVGALTGDKELSREGRLERVRLDQLRKAVDLDSIAESRKNEADAELQARLDADAERLRGIEEKSEERRRAAEWKRQEDARRVAERAQRKAAVAEKAEKETAKAVKKVDRSARSARVRAERGAVAKQRSAVAAKKTAAAIDEEVQATKAARQRK